MVPGGPELWMWTSQATYVGPYRQMLRTIRLWGFLLYGGHYTLPPALYNNKNITLPHNLWPFSNKQFYNQIIGSIRYITIHVVFWRISSRFFINSEAKASELIKNLEGILGSHEYITITRPERVNKIHMFAKLHYWLESEPFRSGWLLW